MNSVTDFVKGFLFIPKGASFLLRQRSLWKGVAAPLLINVVGFSASLYFSFSYLAGFAGRLIEQQGWFWTALGFLAKLLAFSASLVLAIVAFIVVGALLSGPFNDWLGVKSLRLLGQPAPAEKTTLARNLIVVLRGLKEALKEVFYFLVIAAGLFVLGWIPVIGLLAPVIGIPFLWYSLVFETVTPCLSERELSFREKRAILAGNRPAVFGFGCGCFLMLLVPLLGFFLLPVGVVGGALLYHRMLRR